MALKVCLIYNLDIIHKEIKDVHSLSQFKESIKNGNLKTVLAHVNGISFPKRWTTKVKNVTFFIYFRVIFSSKKQATQFSFLSNLYFQQKRAWKLSNFH